ncbi:hypothetical protein M1L60_31350 [Actinoplanes sp. TRM 88003]|uniref:Lipoprotein n=1 Tax=Paractinoplanes aksuensis TaxID=2939490 RepID=A0ABT1DWC8_9ACTN|nr:hypothetical protein [Actinoplanes aksuensis]MCO8275085.1 hypothetical protein [Actinoplanes aksuensis]
MIARRIATLVATLLAVGGAGACGNAATTDPRRTEPAAIAPAPAEARTPTREVQAVAAATTGVRNVPAAFRLPPGSRVAGLADGEAGASFTLTAPGPEAVLSFYRRELQRSTFTIVADHAEAGATSLSFRDADGWAGTIYATAQRATVAIRRA